MELTDLDRRIVGALMARPRASWRTIAGALKAPERTVARRGGDLLESGVVQVVGILSRNAPVLVLIRAAPGTVRVGARAVAARDDTSFVYEVTGAADCVAEVLSTHEKLAAALSEELPSVIGVQHISSNPVLRYFKTLKDWQPGLLRPDEVAALGPVEAGTLPRFGHYPALDGRDVDIVETLRRDGRAPAEVVARRAGISEATARRRIDALIRSSALQIRALVAPADLGLPVQALLFVKAPPRRVEAIGRQIAQSERARYVVALAGEYQIVADITVPTLGDLFDHTAAAPWAEEAAEVTTSLVLAVHKRGGRSTTP